MTINSPRLFDAHGHMNIDHHRKSENDCSRERNGRNHQDAANPAIRHSSFVIVEGTLKAHFRTPGSFVLVTQDGFHGAGQRRGEIFQERLAILLGQQLLRNNTKVMGSEIMAGLRRSGVSISRADYVLRNLIVDACVTATGYHRRRRYRLTNRGIDRAQEVARSLAATLTNVTK